MFNNTSFAQLFEHLPHVSFLVAMVLLVVTIARVLRKPWKLDRGKPRLPPLLWQAQRFALPFGLLLTFAVAGLVIDPAQDPEAVRQIGRVGPFAFYYVAPGNALVFVVYCVMVDAVYSAAFCASHYLQYARACKEAVKARIGVNFQVIGSTPSRKAGTTWPEVPVADANTAATQAMPAPQQPPEPPEPKVDNHPLDHTMDDPTPMGEPVDDEQTPPTAPAGDVRVLGYLTSPPQPPGERTILPPSPNKEPTTNPVDPASSGYYTVEGLRKLTQGGGK